MRKKGICFNCEKQGHIDKNPHPNHEGKTADSKPKAAPEVNSICVAPRPPAKETRKPASKDKAKLYNQKREGKGDVVAIPVPVPFRRINSFQHGDSVLLDRFFSPPDLSSSPSSTLRATSAIWIP